MSLRDPAMPHVGLSVDNMLIGSPIPVYEVWEAGRLPRLFQAEKSYSGLLADPVALVSGSMRK